MRLSDVPSTCRGVSQDDVWWRRALSWLTWGQQCPPRFHAKQVHLCACHAYHGGLWNWGPQMYWPPPYFESFSSLSRPIAQRDLIGSSASPSCSTRLGWSTLFASPSFFDGTWSSRSPHTVARQKLVNFTPWLFASWTATSNGSSLGTCSWGPINNQHWKHLALYGFD